MYMYTYYHSFSRYILFIFFSKTRISTGIPVPGFLPGTTVGEAAEQLAAGYANDVARRGREVVSWRHLLVRVLSHFDR